ncbi:DUF397 domain-containing protein [Nocardiopsis sp. LSu2-4]|uniref:DUF397 domain-containing protein n=1 Tax=Nocardiopsis suaedae TaxID=3018444 RepID=A0ABT4TTK7_9ACTN|nr:DUF397 domain-containing protein [Nocardiopsis suaedae]MDA2807575.1 DUF397 domain-containing protein [Nocardiopsis suaedae]
MGNDGRHWRKSSYSDGGGGNCLEVSLAAWNKSSHSTGANTSCVEVALPWQKSSYSGANTNACVEVARGARTLVRDTQNRPLGHLAFPSSEWQAFLRATSVRAL